jgi:hypothetical protein
MCTACAHLHPVAGWSAMTRSTLRSEERDESDLFQRLGSRKAPELNSHGTFPEPCLSWYQLKGGLGALKFAGLCNGRIFARKTAPARPRGLLSWSLAHMGMAMSYTGTVNTGKCH